MEEQEEIFVSIAAYLDLDTKNTILDCLEKARNPERIVFGVCWQYDDNIQVPADYLEILQAKAKVQTRKFFYTESKGPSWARKQASKLYNGETFFLQVDAHLRFIKDWDSLLVSNLNELKKKCNHPLISFLPPTFNGEVLEYKEQLDFLNYPKIIGISKDHLFEYQENNERSSGFKNYPSPILEPGFIFGEGRWLVENIFEESIYYVGEEVYQSVCSYIQGYDFYLPKQIVAWRRAYYPSRIKHYSTHPFCEPREKMRIGLRRLHEVLQNKLWKDIPFQKRSLEDYQEYAGIQFHIAPD